MAHKAHTFAVTWRIHLAFGVGCADFIASQICPHQQDNSCRHAQHFRPSVSDKPEKPVPRHSSNAGCVYQLCQERPIVCPFSLTTLIHTPARVRLLSNVHLCESVFTSAATTTPNSAYLAATWGHSWVRLIKKGKKRKKKQDVMSIYCHIIIRKSSRLLRRSILEFN